MKPHTVFTVTRRILTETGSALLTVTVSETDEELVINRWMNGELSYVYSAMTSLTGGAVDLAKRPRETYIASRMNEQPNGGEIMAISDNPPGAETPLTDEVRSSLPATLRILAKIHQRDVPTVPPHSVETLEEIAKGRAEWLAADLIETLERANAELTRQLEARFYDGVLSAIAVLAAHDEPTIACDVMNTIDKAALFKVADEHDLKNLKQLGIKP